MAIERVGVAGMTPVGFQTMSLANSTAIAINSTCKLASILHISVETQSCRYRDDNTAPTLTTGVLLDVGEHWILGYDGSVNSTGTVKFKFQRSTGTSKVSLMAYRQPGGDR
jgi:hypothetical protein